MTASTAIRLATSPAAWPPRPSASDQERTTVPGVIGGRRREGAGAILVVRRGPCPDPDRRAHDSLASRAWPDEDAVARYRFVRLPSPSGSPVRGAFVRAVHRTTAVLSPLRWQLMADRRRKSGKTGKSGQSGRATPNGSQPPAPRKINPDEPVQVGRKPSSAGFLLLVSVMWVAVGIIILFTFHASWKLIPGSSPSASASSFSGASGPR